MTTVCPSFTSSTALLQLSHFATVGKYGVALSVVEKATRKWEPTVVDFGNIRTTGAVTGGVRPDATTRARAGTSNSAVRPPVLETRDSRQRQDGQAIFSQDVGGHGGRWEEYVPQG